MCNCFVVKSYADCVVRCGVIPGFRGAAQTFTGFACRLQRSRYTLNNYGRTLYNSYTRASTFKCTCRKRRFIFFISMCVW